VCIYAYGLYPWYQYKCLEIPLEMMAVNSKTDFRLLNHNVGGLMLLQAMRICHQDIQGLEKIGLI